MSPADWYGDNMLKLKKGLHLESLRQPFRKALMTASEIGAQGVEINGRTELRPAELTRTGVRHLKKILNDLKLKVSAIHFPTRRGYDDVQDLDSRIEATRKAMDMAYQLGCQIVTNHIGRVPEEEDSDRWTTMIQALTDLGNYSQKAGAWLAAQTVTEDGPDLKRLIDVLPPMAIGIDFDPAAMMINGFSALEAMKILAPSVMNLRARDAVKDLSLGRGLEVQLGRGSVDLPGLLGILEEHHYNGYITIERDTQTDAVLQCAQSLEYLDNLFR
jgi:sugar phosphate isomerase/epimerase